VTGAVSPGKRADVQWRAARGHSGWGRTQNLRCAAGRRGVAKYAAPGELL
jgi:hypothetical protein